MSATTSNNTPQLTASGHLTRSDGSIELSIGKSSVICAVLGPIPAEMGRANPLSAIVECSVKIPTPVTESETEGKIEDYLSKALEQTAASVLALDQYPKMKFVVSFQVVNNDGSLLSLCLNALSMVLLEAGMPCRYAYTAVSSCQIIEDDTVRLVYNPSKECEALARCDLTIAIAVPRHAVNLSQLKSEPYVDEKDDDEDKVIFLDVKGSWPIEDLFNSIALCKDHCLSDAATLRKSLS